MERDNTKNTPNYFCRSVEGKHFLTRENKVNTQLLNQCCTVILMIPFNMIPFKCLRCSKLKYINLDLFTNLETHHTLSQNVSLFKNILHKSEQKLCTIGQTGTRLIYDERIKSVYFMSLDK